MIRLRACWRRICARTATSTSGSTAATRPKACPHLRAAPRCLLCRRVAAGSWRWRTSADTCGFGAWACTQVRGGRLRGRGAPPPPPGLHALTPHPVRRLLPPRPTAHQCGDVAAPSARRAALCARAAAVARCVSHSRRAAPSAAARCGSGEQWRASAPHRRRQRVCALGGGRACAGGESGKAQPHAVQHGGGQGTAEGARGWHRWRCHRCCCR